MSGVGIWDFLSCFIDISEENRMLSRGYNVRADMNDSHTVGLARIHRVLFSLGVQISSGGMGASCRLVCGEYSNDFRKKVCT